MSAQLAEVPDDRPHSPGPARVRDELGDLGNLENLAARILALRDAGAARWDEPAFVYLTSLQARLTQRPVGSGVDPRMVSRAFERCAALEREMDEARARIAALSVDVSGDSDDELRAALDVHDLPTAEVLAVLATLPAPSERAATSGRWLESAAQLEASLLEARTAVVSARAHAVGSEASGPYNRAALAGRLLARLDELAPGYLRACVAALDDLAALGSLAAVAASAGSRQKSPDSVAPRSRRPRASRLPKG